MWSVNGYSQLNRMDEKAPLAHESIVYGVCIKRSKISCLLSAFGCLMNQALTTGESIGYYYGTLVHKNMYS